jgi:hypothetical protein
VTLRLGSFMHCKHDTTFPSRGSGVGKSRGYSQSRFIRAFSCKSACWLRTTSNLHVLCDTHEIGKSAVVRHTVETEIVQLRLRGLGAAHAMRRARGERRPSPQAPPAAGSRWHPRLAARPAAAAHRSRPPARRCANPSAQRCDEDARSAFASCEHAAALALGSNVP